MSDGRGDCGGATTRRHDEVVHILATCLETHATHPVWALLAQRKKNNTTSTMKIMRNTREGTSEFIFVTGTRLRSSQKAAAAEAEKTKIRRHPNVTELVPVAIETGGRIGNMATSCIRRYAREQVEEHTKAMKSFREVVREVLQTRHVVM